DKQLTSFTKQHLLDHMNEYYIPRNIVISVAGNVDTEFIDTIEKYFDRFNHQGTESERIKPVFCNEIIQKEKNTEQAHLCLGYEGLAMNDKMITSMLVVNNVLGGGMSSRLFQEVREKRGLA